MICIGQHGGQEHHRPVDPSVSDGRQKRALARPRYARARAKERKEALKRAKRRIIDWGGETNKNPAGTPVQNESASARGLVVRGPGCLGGMSHAQISRRLMQVALKVRGASIRLASGDATFVCADTEDASGRAAPLIAQS